MFMNLKLHVLDFLEDAANDYPDTFGITAAFSLGFLEATSDVGMTWDCDAESPRSRAYDYGRDLFRVMFSPFGICER